MSCSSDDGRRIYRIIYPKGRYSVDSGLLLGELKARSPNLLGQRPWVFKDK